MLHYAGLKMEFFSKIKFNRKLYISIIVPILLTLILSFVTMYYIFVPGLEESMLNQRKLMLKEMTKTVFSLIDTYNKKFEAGLINLEDAKITVKNEIEKLRYGSDNKDYFWIQDYECVLLMHPYTKDLVGKDLTNYKDKNGKRLLFEMVNIVKAKGKGFVNYSWQWKDDQNTVRDKLSFVRGFKKWNWIIGTGVYIEDLRNEISLITNKINITFGVIFAFIIFLSVFILLQTRNAARKIVESSEALKLSEQNYRQIFNSTADAIFVHDIKTGEILDLNDTAIKLTKYNKNDLLDDTVSRFSDTKAGYTSDGVREKILEATRIGEINFEWKGIKDNGSSFWLDVKLKKAIILNKTRVLAVVRDITQQKIAQQALRKSEERHRLLVEGMNDGLAIANFDGLFTYVNPKFCEMIGYKSEVLTNAPIVNFLTSESAEVYKKNLAKRKKGIIERYILYWVKSNSDILITSISPQPFYNENNVFTGSSAIISDITNKKLSEEELIRFLNFKKIITELSTEFISIPFNQIQNGINHALKLLGEFIKVDRCFINHFNDEFTYIDNTNEWIREGLPSIKKHFRNKSINKNSFILNNTINGFSVIINDITNELRFSSDEKEILDRFNIKSILIVPLVIGDKTVGQIGLESIKSMHTWKDEEIELLSIVGNIIINALLRKDFENSLLKSKERAERSEQLKSEFLAQISHEIRTPINTILSFATLIKEEISDDISDDLIDCFYHMNSAGNRIIRTIDLILNMSEIQTGTYEYKKVEADLLNDIVKLIFNEYKILAEQKGLVIELNIQTIDTRINIDKYTVGQIVANLVDNAIKYTEQGTVEVIISRNKLNCLLLEVKDTGIGISEEYLPNIFSEFTQEEQGYTRKFEGNGLGLALVKKYCEMNGAVISVMSTKGEGSTFRVDFNDSCLE